MLDTLHIEANGIPIYIQIRDQILAAVAAGALKPGDRLPTMREVAVALKVDLNTVRHAYDSAQESGAIVLVRAQGTYVAERPPDVSEDRLEKLAQSIAVNAYSQGVNLRDLIDRLNQIAAGQRAGGGTS
ncbi:MAG TPA: GntR family transcriptional regulator [Alphaproteobacteria bacterium]|jgi:GntR family transcriptional regulator|nr:GntR family transcriptional regulator [Alphaproteobacteria bacterium]